MVFERGLLQKEHDPSVCARLRAMHLVKHLELRHQFKVLRDAIGASGLPDRVVESYVTVLYHLVRQPSTSATGTASKDAVSQLQARSNAAIADQKKIVSAGALVLLASLVTRTPTRLHVAETAKAIVLEIATSLGADAVTDVLACNIVQRVVVQVAHLMQQRAASTSAAFVSSMQLLATLTDVVLQAKRAYKRASSPDRGRAAGKSTSAQFAGGTEHAYRLKVLAVSAKTHLATPSVVHVLFEVLQYDAMNAALCASALSTLQLLASSFGFPEVLDALTRNGGRSLETVLQCFQDADATVVTAAVSLFYELTDRPDARNGLTTAGAPQLLLRWCSLGIESSKTPALHVLGLIGVALLARQTHHATSSAKLLASLATLADRLDALYSILLDLVLDSHVEQSALYLLHANALPSLLQTLLQVKPSCMDSSFQSPHQRNVSCVVLGRIFKVPQVAQRCFSEDVVNHLALSLQCNRLDEIEHVVAKMSPHERSVHVMATTDACKALSRLTRCPSTSVRATLRPSLTSASVPELPQALICDVLFRLHALEDVIARIASPSDGAEFVELELERTLAAIELSGYVRPLPFGDSARAKFLKATDAAGRTSVFATYATTKLLALVELVAPAILQVLREKSACSELVKTCCAALSRLACTNAACSVLLAQGALAVALVHLPAILFAASPSRRRSDQQQQSYAPDASVDDHGLLDVPASLFTLIGKLCAVADGRAAVMRLQVLPRLLKRLQLRDSVAKTVDDDCKGEIAVVLQRLAMVNAVEGNTSELFLHFHVLELLVQLAQAQDIPALVQGRSGSRKPHKWRLLDHTLGAVAALSQDVLVCVPKVVELGVLTLVLPFVLRVRTTDVAAPRAEALQYHALSIVRSVAAYPFGKYHALLQRIEDASATARRASSSSGGTSSTEQQLVPTRLLERVKKVAYNFALELENRPTSSLDKKTVGELARETLTFLHDCAERTGAESGRSPNRASSPFASSTSSPSRRTSTRLTSKPTPPHKLDERKAPAFPALHSSPLSPHRRESGLAAGDDSARPQSSPRSPQLALVRSTPLLLPSQVSPQRTLSPLESQALSPNTSALLSSVDLMRTRPAGSKPPIAAPDDASRQHQQQEQQPRRSRAKRSSVRAHDRDPAPYTFARPKATTGASTALTKSTPIDAMASCLMLDPLFQTSANGCVSGSGPRVTSKQRAAKRTHVRESDDTDECAPSFVFAHELERLGHCVNVQARRATPGDTYVQSLGHIAMRHSSSIE